MKLREEGARPGADSFVALPGMAICHLAERAAILLLLLLLLRAEFAVCRLEQEKERG